MRILLFILTNMAVVLVMGVVWRLLGFESILDNQGIDLDFNSLLVFCALFGMGGSLVSLFISKWSAKRGTRTRIIETPSNRDENGFCRRYGNLPIKRHWHARSRHFPPTRRMPSLPSGTATMHSLTSAPGCCSGSSPKKSERSWRTKLGT